MGDSALVSAEQADFSDERRRSSVRRVSVMETKKANVARTGMALALTPAQEDAHVFRPDRNQTMFSNSEAFAVAKQNFVKLVGQVEPVADRIAEEASNPRTALQKEVLLRKQRFSGANNSSSYIAKRNELKRWKVSNKEIAGPAGKRAFAVELERINKSGDDDDVKAQRRLELKEKMEAAGVKEEVRDVVKKAGRDPRVNCDFKDWDPATASFPCPSTAAYQEPDGPAHFRELDRILEFQRETELQSAARRETDREEEAGTLAAVLKERRYSRMREYFNTTVKKHEEADACGISVDTAERTRRSHLRSERRKRLKENPHGLKFKGSRRKRGVLGKVEKGLCMCFRKKRRLGTADSDAPSTAGSRLGTSDFSGFGSIFSQVKESGSRASTAISSRASTALSQVKGDSRSFLESFGFAVSKPASAVERICVKGCGFAGTDGVVQAHEKTCDFVEGAPAPSPSPKRKKKKKRNTDWDEDGKYKCSKGCGRCEETPGLMEKHEASCEFVPDPTRCACSKNCGFYGLKDATARHEVNCDYVDPRIAQREAAREKRERKEKKATKRSLRIKGVEEKVPPVEAEAPAPAAEAVPLTERLTLTQKLNPWSSPNKKKKRQRKLEKAQDVLDKAKFELETAEALPQGAYGVKKVAAAKEALVEAEKTFAVVQKKCAVREAPAPPPLRKKWSLFGRKVAEVVVEEEIVEVVEEDDGLPIKPHRRSGVTPAVRRGTTKLRRKIVVAEDPDAPAEPVKIAGKKKKDKPLKVPKDLREEVQPLAEQYFLFLGDDLQVPVADHELQDAAVNDERVVDYVRGCGSKMFQSVILPNKLDPVMRETETHMPGKFTGEEFVNAIFKAVSTKLTIEELRRQERLNKQEERKLRELAMVKKLHFDSEAQEEEKRIQARIDEEKAKKKKKVLLRWQRRFCGCFVPYNKEESIWRDEDRRKEEEVIADLNYEEKQQYRKDKKWKKSLGYQVHLVKKKYFFWVRYPRLDDVYAIARFTRWVWSKCGIPRPVIRLVLCCVRTGDSVGVWIGLRFAKVYFASKVVYKALENFVSGAAQYDYDDLTAAVLEGNTDMLRLIFMDKHSAMSADETSMDGKTMLFMCMERLLQTEHTLKNEMMRLAKEGRVAPNLFYLPMEQQRRELEEVQTEDDEKTKLAEKEADRKERQELKLARKETKKRTNVQSGHIAKMRKKKKTKGEKMKEAALRETSPLDLMKKCEKLQKTCEFLVKRGSSINTQQDPRKHDGSGWGLLHHAATHSNVKQMKWVLSKGALVDLATEEGETPLMMAALSGATRGCQFLLEYGAVVTKAAQNGWTPLHFAGHAGAIDAAALLLRAGASKDARTIGDTLRPADCAVEKKHPDCAEVIRLYREPPVQVKEVFDMMDAAAASSRASTASDLLNMLAGESLASMASAQTMLGLS